MREKGISCIVVGLKVLVSIVMFIYIKVLILDGVLDMKIDDLIDIDKSKKYIDYNKLPDEFYGILMEEKSIENGILWDIYIPEMNSTMRERLTTLHFKSLAESLEKLNLSDTQELIGKKYKFERFLYRVGYPRWFPVEKIDE